jgi:hypothetical protein
MRKTLLFIGLIILSALPCMAQDGFDGLAGYYAFKLKMPHVEELSGKLHVYRENGENCATLRAKGKDFPIRSFKLGEDGKFHAIAKVFRYTVPVTLETDFYYGVILSVSYQKKSFPVVLETITQFDYDDGGVSTPL